MTEALIVSAVRTAVGKAPSGALRTTRPDEMGAVVLREALARAPGVAPDEIDDVVIGCAMPEAEQGLNVARIASLRAGVPVSAVRRASGNRARIASSAGSPRTTSPSWPKWITSTFVGSAAAIAHPSLRQ